mgnify:CR=1 FL=1
MNSATNKAIAAITLIGMAGSAAPALADDWKERARGQLQFVGLTLEGDGWTLDRELHLGGLNDADTGFVPLRLDDRTDYAIVAVCDAQCGDLDLFLYDSDDSLVAEDCAEAGLPVVHITPDERERFDLAVKMVECAEAPCSYSVAVYSAPALTPRGFADARLDRRDSDY